MSQIEDKSQRQAQHDMEQKQSHDNTPWSEKGERQGHEDGVVTHLAHPKFQLVTTGHWWNPHVRTLAVREVRVHPSAHRL